MDIVVLFAVGLAFVIMSVMIYPIVREKFVDLIAKNVREPKGVAGRIVRFILGKGNAYLENQVVEHLNIQPNHKVLEVGFGSGIGIRAALKKMENGHGRVYGVDISEQMVTCAMKEFKLAVERQRLEIHLGSVMDLPFQDNLFDSVFHTNCYYFWPDLEQGIAELKRVMKPGALMITGMIYAKLKGAADKGFMRYGPHWQPAKYMERLEEGGFMNVTMETVKKASGPSYEIILASKAIKE
ncbi:putative methyltransferase YdaC [Acropora palmata]|uniref:putative methyltransferase YdaC n=1 Tax=Acropora palmata TaxID=6131 RepID=UPI003DA0F1EE